MTKRAQLILTAAVSLLCGAAFSFLKLQYHCRIPDSEACVWGKAYFSIALPMEAIVVGLVLFAIVAGLRHLRSS